LLPMLALRVACGCGCGVWWWPYANANDMYRQRMTVFSSPACAAHKQQLHVLKRWPRAQRTCTAFTSRSLNNPALPTQALPNACTSSPSLLRRAPPLPIHPGRPRPPSFPPCPSHSPTLPNTHAKVPGHDGAVAAVLHSDARGAAPADVDARAHQVAQRRRLLGHLRGPAAPHEEHTRSAGATAAAGACSPPRNRTAGFCGHGARQYMASDGATAPARTPPPPLPPQACPVAAGRAAGRWALAAAPRRASYRSSPAPRPSSCRAHALPTRAPQSRLHPPPPERHRSRPPFAAVRSRSAPRCARRARWRSLRAPRRVR
jgi:hypothetical protein